MEGSINTVDVEEAATSVPLPMSSSSNKSGNANHEIAPTQSDQSNTKNRVPRPQGQGVNKNVDPKKLKRVAASREYSQRYRLKQLQYTAQLETGVRALQAEVALAVPRIKYADTQNSLLRAENSSMRQKLSALSGQLMMKEAEYHELKKERDALKQLSLLYQAPYGDQMSQQTKHYNYQQMVKMGQPGFINQFMESGGASNMPNQNLGNQFGPGFNNEDNPM